MILPWDVPVDPEPPEAQQWLITELSKPEYQAAKPTPLDLLAKAISEWFSSLQFGTVEGPPAFGLLVVLIILAGVLVVAFLIFGLPRLNRRSRVTGTLFGEHDDRSAADMRRDASAAASRGDYSTAIAELFRALARGLAERTIVTVTPGTTARGFSGRAGAAFPEFADRLLSAADAFDGVRYLGQQGTADDYASLVSLEAQVRAAKPSESATPPLRGPAVPA